MINSYNTHKNNKINLNLNFKNSKDNKNKIPKINIVLDKKDYSRNLKKFDYFESSKNHSFSIKNIYHFLDSKDKSVNIYIFPNSKSFGDITGCCRLFAIVISFNQLLQIY